MTAWIKLSNNLSPKRILFLLISLFIPVVFVSAQSGSVRFVNYTTKDGLSNNWVKTITQDQYGFLWFGTDYGLNRFDGYRFITYRQNPKLTYSLGSSDIIQVYEDRKGRFWVLTRNTLDFYDRKNDRFITKFQRGREPLTSVVEDRKSDILWISSSTTLFKFDPETDSTLLSLTSNELTMDRGNFGPSGIFTLYIDRKNNLWIGTSRGLHRYNTEAHSFASYYTSKTNPKSLSDNYVYRILEDSYGRIWVGTYSGLNVLVNPQENPNKAVFVRYRNEIGNPKSIFPGRIMSLYEDQDKNLWIGVENAGLCKVSLSNNIPGNNDFTRFENEPGNLSSLSAKTVYSIYQDHNGNLWFGTFDGGISVLNEQLNRFFHVHKVLGNAQSLSDNHVNVFCEDGDVLWIGTEGGLNKWDRKKNTFTSYTMNPYDNRSIGSNAVWAISKDREGNLWIGTWGGGLNRFDYKTQTFQRFLTDPQNPASIGSNNVFSIFEDSKGNLWIGTMGGGLNLFDRKQKTFVRYNVSTSGIYTNYVSAIIEAEPGVLWLVNETVVAVFHVSTRTFEHFIHDPNDSTTISSSKIISLYKDSRGNIWVSTNAGLNLYDKEKKTFKVYTMEHGLPDDCINSIVEDQDGNLWLGTNNGLAKFVKGTEVPSHPVFKNYRHEDGLQGASFNRRSCYKDKQGILYFGGSNGFNVFNPKSLIDNKSKPPVVITELRLFNKPIALGEAGLRSDEESVVFLPYKPVFTIEYAALNYVTSSKNQYAYKLEGFDKDWNYVGTQRTATYTNLNSGEYVFVVKGSNNDGVWNEDGIRLRIVIIPAIWERWWFRGGILLILLTIGYGTYRWWKKEKELEEGKRLAEVVASTASRERNLLRTLIDNIPDEIFVQDVTNTIIVCNRTFLERLHIQNEKDILGRSIGEFLSVESLESVQREYKELTEHSKSVHTVEGKSLLGSDERWVLRSTAAIRDTDGSLKGFVVIERDISERRAHEKEREELINELQRALADVKVLSGLIPICANCKKIRNDQGYWIQLEAFIQAHSETRFTHGLCPECASKLYPDFSSKKQNK